MNFQTVSVAQQLRSTSATLIGPDAHGDRMVSAIRKQGLAGSTTIILTAKHGQSLQDPKQLVTVQDGPIVSAVNAAWALTHPKQPEP